MTIRALLAALALGPLAAAQIPEPAPPSPFDRVATIATGESFEYVAEFSGSLFVWPAWKPGESALTLAVGDATDDGEAGKRTPFLQREVEPGSRLTIVVTAEGSASGTLSLHLVAAPETSPTRAAAGTSAAALAEIRELREAGVLDEARRRIEALIEELLALEGARQSDQVANALWTCGDEGRALGQLHALERAWCKTLEHRLRTLPDDHPFLQEARQNFAALLYILGNLAGVHELEKQVLAVYARTLPDDHPELQRARGNLASTLHTLGDLRAARALREQVLAVYARTLPEDHPERLMAQEGLASSLLALGDLAGGRDLQEHVLAVCARTLPEDHPDLARARQRLAGTILAFGDFGRARVLQEQALETCLRTLPDDHPHLQNARHELAATLSMLGDLAGARALQEQVLAVFSRSASAGHPDLMGARFNLGVTLFKLGEFARARTLFEQVLAAGSSLPEDHQGLLAARGNLAVALRALGEPADARALQEQVLAVRERTLPEDHPDLQTARINLSYTLRILGDFEAARALQEQVLAVRVRTLPGDHPDLATAWMNIAFTLARQRAREGEGQDEAFAELCVTFTEALSNRARAAWLEGSTREAEERLARMEADLGVGLSLAQGLGVFSSDRASLDAAFVASECTRGAALVSAQLVRTARAHPQYASMRAALADARTGVANAGQRGSDPGALERALTQREAAERELLAAALELGAGEALASELDVAAFAAALAPGEPAIAFRRYCRFAVDADSERHDHDFCAFVLRSDAAGAPLARVELGEAAAIEKAIAAWCSGIETADGRGLPAGSSSTGLESNDGEAVRRLVWDPLVPALGDARRVLVVADDVLHAVPFDALPLDGGTLGEQLAIDRRLTLTELLWQEPEPEGKRTLVALGDAEYGPAPEGPVSFTLRGGPLEAGFAPLPHTGAEARGIAALSRGDAVVLAGREAARDRVVVLAPQARYLHLATHGWFAPESIRSSADPEIIDPALGVVRQTAEERIIGSSPMVLCGLALAGANLPADEFGRYSGIVTAEEIAGWDLASCELAVLSACDTNVGLRRAGQGVASLQKALQIAGARSVITSLWKVSDEATKDLMLDFYRRLWVLQKPKHQALWEAKMHLREAREENGAPKYATRDWAAWVLTGDST